MSGESEHRSRLAPKTVERLDAFREDVEYKIGERLTRNEAANLAVWVAAHVARTKTSPPIYAEWIEASRRRVGRPAKTPADG